MNSSANQISPHQPLRPACRRAWPIINNRQVSRTARNTVKRLPPPAGICRQRKELGKAESWASAGVRRGFGLAVKLHKPSILPDGRMADSIRRKAAINGISIGFYAFTKYLRLTTMVGFLHLERIAAVEFESANPTIIKSIKQRDLLNTWLRLYAREQRTPRIGEYQPERLADELPDLVYYTVDTALQPPRLLIQSDGTRMSSAYGNTGKGRYLDEYMGPRLAPVVMPVYYECIRRALPVYTISDIDDIYGRIVAYERLLLPFGQDGHITHMIASLKTISEDGGFEIRNLMRGNDTLPVAKLRSVIDRDLFHRAPGRIPPGDVIEFG
jgi:hypothetical protein